MDEIANQLSHNKLIFQFNVIVYDSEPSNLSYSSTNSKKSYINRIVYRYIKEN